MANVDNLYVKQNGSWKQPWAMLGNDPTPKYYKEVLVKVAGTWTTVWKRDNTPSTGISDNADKLTTPRNIASTGEVAWDVDFDGSADVSGPAVILNSAVTGKILTGLSVGSSLQVVDDDDTILQAIGKLGGSDAYLDANKIDKYVHVIFAGTSKTIAASDIGTIIECTSASPITITIPAVSSGLFVTGDDFYIFSSGGGQITVVPSGAATLETPVASGTAKTRTTDSLIGLRMKDVDEWLAFGDLEPTAPALSVLARIANSIGVPAFTAASSNDTFFGRVGNLLGFFGITGAQVGNTPAGNILATNVQDALAELDSEKQPLDTQLTTIAGMSLTGQAGKVLKVNTGGTDFELGAAATDLTAVTTDIKITEAGKGLYMAEGVNATMGVATLVAGTVTISNTKITANSRVFVSIQSLGTVSVPKAIGMTAKSAGVSFTLTSADATDTSVIAWMIIEAISTITLPNSYLKFNGTNGSTTFTDEYGKTWTAAGNAQISTAQSKSGGASGLFDGNGDYVTLTNHADYAFGTGDFTVSAWVRVDAAVAAWARLMENEAFNVTGGWHLSFNGSDSAGNRRLGFQRGLNGGGGSRIDTNAAFPTGVWTHFAVARASGVTAMYVNGVKQTATLTDTDNYTSQKMRIGSVLGTAGNYYTGYIDEMKVYKGVALYTATFNVPASLLHFSGTDGSTTFTDDSGKVWTASGNAQIDTAQSIFGGAAGLFDGTGDYISTPAATDFDFGTGDYTIEFWARPNALGTVALVDFRPASTNGHYASIFLNLSGGSGSVGCYINSAVAINSANGVISTGVWTHIALCRSASNTKLFVGGVQVGSTYSDANNYPQGRVYIGASAFDSGAAFNYNGHIDEFRVSKGKAYYTTNFTPPSAEFEYP